MKISIPRAISESRLVELTKHVNSYTGWDPSIDVVLLDTSPGWILARSVTAFDPDGYYVISRGINPTLRTTKHDAFRKQIMEKEGLWSRVVRRPRIDLTDIGSILLSLRKLGEYAVLVCETFGVWDSTYCRIGSVAEDHVVAHGFDGTGRWEKKRIQIKTAEITTIRFGSRYLRLYRKYSATSEEQKPKRRFMFSSSSSLPQLQNRP